MRLFSVIIITCNNSKYLGTCVDSVLCQDYENIEIIISDDGSVEFNENYWRGYINSRQGKNIVRVVVHKNPTNAGTVKNINGALSIASGEYFKVIAGDDALANNTVLTNAAKSLELAGSGIITSNVIECDKNMNPQKRYRDGFQRKMNSLSTQECFSKMCIHNGVIAGGVFFSKTYLEEYGYFDENYRLLEDWPKWLQVFQKGGRIDYFDFDAVYYRKNNGVGTSNNCDYLNDKRKVMKDIIIPNRKRINAVDYLFARVAFCIINAKWIRSIYGLFTR